jgi:hypothetical protein
MSLRNNLVDARDSAAAAAEKAEAAINAYDNSSSPSDPFSEFVRRFDGLCDSWNVMFANPQYKPPDADVTMITTNLRAIQADFEPERQRRGLPPAVEIAG